MFVVVGKPRTPSKGGTVDDRSNGSGFANHFPHGSIAQLVEHPVEARCAEVRILVLPRRDSRLVPSVSRTLGRGDGSAV